MANWQVISLDTTTPQLRAPGTGDGYSFNSGSTTLGTWTTTGLTLSTGTLTVSSGTANGVLYLNGSNVATSGSVLTFDGTNLRIGGSGSGARLVVRGTGTTSATFSIEAATSSGATRFIVADDGLCRWYGTSNAETMRLDNAGNLGIGTTSPSGKLHVNGNFLRIDQSGANQVYFGNAGDLITGAPAGGAIRFDGTALRFASSSTQIAMFDSSGRLLVGGTSAAYASSNGAIEVQSANGASLNAGRFAANTGGPTLTLLKSRGATVGANTIVVDGDSLGDVSFVGANGTGYDEAARIRASVDGTPGASADMPGRLTFWTSADGSATPTERMRISNAGNVVVNTAAVATTATDGFLYIPTCAGAPTGVPTTFTGRSPLVVDSTNNRFYVYVNGAWKYATLT